MSQGLCSKSQECPRTLLHLGTKRRLYYSAQHCFSRIHTFLSRPKADSGKGRERDCTSGKSSDGKFFATKIRLHVLIIIILLFIFFTIFNATSRVIGNTIDHCMNKLTSTLLEYGFAEHS